MRNRHRSSRVRSSVITVALVTGLAACGSSLPEPEPDRAPASPDPVISEEQLSNLLDEIELTLDGADEELNAEALESRFSGSALRARKAEYKSEAADPTQEISEIPRDVSMSVIPATEEWPRSIMVVTEPPTDSQIPRILVLTQETPRDNYSLSVRSQLLPGVSMPAMPLPTEGARPVPVDAEDYVLAPADVGEGFVDVLKGKKKDDDDSQSGKFGEDQLSERIREEYSALKDGVSEVGSVKKTFKTPEEPIATFEAIQGGAIVVTTVTETTSFTVDSGSLNVSSETSHLLGKDSVSSELKTTHTLSLVFYVPENGSDDEIQVLGETRDFVSAKGK